MPKYNVVNTDALVATRGGKHIFSYLFDQDIENGMFVIDAGAIEGEREIRACAKPDGTTRVALVANPVDITCACLPSGYNEDQFVNAADKPFRAYDLGYGDIFSVADYGMDLLSIDAVPGNFVHLVAGNERLVEVAAQPTGEAFVGEIIDVGSFPAAYGTSWSSIPSDGSFKWVSIRVIQNETV